MRLVKATQLSSDEITQAQDLVRQVEMHDGAPIKIFWEPVVERRNAEYNDFLIYQDDKLVSYLAVYQIAEDQVEVATITHPEYRQQGYFSRLWLEVTLELHQRGVAGIILNQNTALPFVADCLTAIGAQFFRHEYVYQCRQRLIPSTDDAKLAFKLCTSADVAALTKLEFAASPGKYSDVREQVEELVAERVRKIYLVYLGNKVIGRVNICLPQGGSVLLYDYYIAPEYQRLGHERELIMQAINQIFNDYEAECVNIVSTSDDYHDNRLYLDLYFELQDTYAQWMYSLAELYKHYGTVH